MAMIQSKTKNLIIASGAALVGILAFNNIVGEDIRSKLETALARGDSLQVKVNKLSADKQDLRDSLDALHQARFDADISINANVVNEELNFDYSKYPDYSLIRDILPTLDLAILYYWNVYPMSKVMLLSQQHKESIDGRILVSSAGAAGRWQWTPEFAESKGLRPFVTDDYATAQALRSTRKILQKQIDTLQAYIDGFIIEHSPLDHQGGDIMGMQKFEQYIGKTNPPVLPQFKEMRLEMEDYRKRANFLKAKEKGHLKKYGTELKSRIRKMTPEQRKAFDPRFDDELMTWMTVGEMAGYLQASDGNILMALTKYNADREAVTLLGYRETRVYSSDIVTAYVRDRAFLAGASQSKLILNGNGKSRIGINGKVN